MAKMAFLRFFLLICLVLGVDQSLCESFHILTFGGRRETDQVHLYNLNSRTGLCSLAALPGQADEQPFGSIVDGSITICGGGIEECFALTQDSQQWLSFEGVERALSSAITTFDAGIWTFVGGISDIAGSSYSVFTEDSKIFSEPIDLGFRIGRGASTVRYNSSHAIISKGSDNVWWYQEDGHRFAAWSEKGGHDRIYTSCGLVSREDGGAQLVLAAGFDGLWPGENLVSVFDFEHNEWHVGQEMLRKMYGATSVPFQNTFLVLGGHSSGKFFGDVYLYNAQEGWTELDMHLDEETAFLGALHVDKGKVECP